MGVRKIHEVFFVVCEGARKPIAVPYRLRLPHDIEFDIAPGVIVRWELIEIRTNVRDEETTYILGECHGFM